MSLKATSTTIRETHWQLSQPAEKQLQCLGFVLKPKWPTDMFSDEGEWRTPHNMISERLLIIQVFVVSYRELQHPSCLVEVKNTPEQWVTRNNLDSILTWFAWNPPHSSSGFTHPKQTESMYLCYVLLNQLKTTLQSSPTFASTDAVRVRRLTKTKKTAENHIWFTWTINGNIQYIFFL